MKKAKLFCATVLAFVSLPVLATSAPSIGGTANINANIEGAIVNAGGGVSGFKGIAKQAVASVLSGSIAGSLTDAVSVKGAIANVAGGASGATMTACQSVGTIGSDCDS